MSDSGSDTVGRIAHRIVVFTGDPSFSVRKGIVEIDRRIPGLQWLVVRHAPQKTARQLIRNQVRNLRKNGWRWVPYQLAELRASIFRTSGSQKESSAAESPGIGYSMESILAKRNVQYYQTPDLHSESTTTKVKDFSPDLGLSIASPILKPALFEICRLGTINLHKGKVPSYRGMPPAFWELWNDEVEIGCTVHQVIAGLDKGDVIAETTVPKQTFSTVKGLQLVLDEVGVNLMCDAVESILNGTARPRPQPVGGKTYTKPTLGEVAELRRRQSWALPVGQSVTRRMAKSIYLRALLHGARTRSFVTREAPTVTVILYHRVTDELRDSLTVGIEQFERQMAILSKYCMPVSIEQVLSGRFRRRPRRPIVCVTFDDGYADNFTSAVPILLRHRIPAAFFVSTGLIGTDRSFPHDVGKVPASLRNMSWQDLRSMKRDGFTVGSHTVGHIDCAKETREAVERELRDSLATLRTNLGTENVILAYPYGGRENMTAERLELVRACGYIGCLSAYGGFNKGTVDPYNVLRCGINWTFSDLAFRSRIAGLH